MKFVEGFDYQKLKTCILHKLCGKM